MHTNDPTPQKPGDTAALPPPIWGMSKATTMLKLLALGPETAQGLRRATGWAPGITLAVLQQLVADGQVTHKNRGGNKWYSVRMPTPLAVDVDNPAGCIACGCTDRNGCPGGCWWLAVDRKRRIGGCSNCRASLVDRSPSDS